MVAGRAASLRRRAAAPALSRSHAQEPRRQDTNAANSQQGRQARPPPASARSTNRDRPLRFRQRSEASDAPPRSRRRQMHARARNTENHEPRLLKGTEASGLVQRESGTLLNKKTLLLARTCVSHHPSSQHRSKTKNTNPLLQYCNTRVWRNNAAATRPQHRKHSQRPTRPDR